MPGAAGKTTAIRIILDFTRPTAGRASVFGRNTQNDGIAARERIGFLLSDPAVFPRMNTFETLDYLAAFRGQVVDTAYRRTLLDRLQFDSRSQPVQGSKVQRLLSAPRGSSGVSTGIVSGTANVGGL